MSAALRRAALWEAALAWDRHGRRARSLWAPPTLAAFADAASTAPLPAAFLAASRARVRRRRLAACLLLALLAGLAATALVTLARETAAGLRHAAAARREAHALTLRARAAEPALLLARAHLLDASGRPDLGLVMAIAAHAAAREAGAGLAQTTQELASRRTQRAPIPPAARLLLTREPEFGTLARGQLAITLLRPTLPPAGRCIATWSAIDGASDGVLDLRNEGAARDVTFAGEPCDPQRAFGESYRLRWPTPAFLFPDAPRDADEFAAWALRRTALRVRRDTRELVVDARPSLDETPWARGATAPGSSTR